MITMTDQIRKFINSIPKLLPDDKTIIKKDNDKQDDTVNSQDDKDIEYEKKISVIVKL
tara:strand:- start:44 stop:217 length:174 start_codon:yes stop_codon:yes gene_type:complete